MAEDHRTSLQFTYHEIAVDAPAVEEQTQFAHRRISRRTLSLVALMIALACLGVWTCCSLWSLKPLKYITPDLIDSRADQQERPAIPRIIHQTYKTDQIPDHWAWVQETVLREHADWQYMFWTDESMRHFIDEHYSWFLPTFDSYPQPIERVDAFRYFALYHFGGVYLDLDIGARSSFEEIRWFEVVLPKTEPIGFSNDFIASAPKHPFMKQLIDQLVDSNRCWVFPMFTVMLSTGPLFVTRQYHRASPETLADVYVMDDDLYSSRGRMLFHVQGSSWHSWDSRILTWFWYRKGNRLLILTPVLMSALLILLRCYRRDTRKQL